tara:strand:- start:64219 stop:64653 length:435 start_codon:yes stop_codon:yes gene_type:complete
VILTKKLYLKRGFFSTAWICLRYLVSSIAIIFRRQRGFKIDQARKIGLPVLTTKQDGELQCNSCGLCIGHCPTSALDLSATSEAKVIDFKLDVLKCVLCGLCQEVCPIDAIRMGHEAPKADHAESNWVLDQSELSKDKIVSRLA